MPLSLLKILILTKRAYLALALIYSYSAATPSYSLPLGNDFLRLNPGASGVDFINVESSFPTPYDSLVLGSIVEYSLGVQPVLNEPGIELESSLDSVLTAHQFMAMGLFPNFELSLRFPIVLHSESLEHPSDKGMLVAEGLSYFSVGGKYRFLKRGMYELSLGTEFGTDLMKDNPYTGKTETIPFMSAVYIASTADYSPIILGVNIGYRFRTTGDPIANPATEKTPISPVPHAALMGLGVTYQTRNLGSFVLEVYGSHDFPEIQDDLTDRLPTGIEVLFAYVKLLKNGIGLKTGVGTDLFRGAGTAQLRVFAGMDYLIDTGKLPRLKEETNPKNPQLKSRPKDIPLKEYYDTPEEEEDENALPTFEDPEDVSL